MKCYVVGSVASGKSTFARKISGKTGIPCHSLDSLVHITDKTLPSGNRKRPIEERGRMFQEILALPDFLMEDTGRECFAEGLRQADTILLLEIPLRVRQFRIVFRWIKQKLGIEKCLYRPGYEMLKNMFRWASDYDTGKDGLKDRLKPFQDKITVLGNNRDIRVWLQGLGKEQAAVGYATMADEEQRHK